MVGVEGEKGFVFHVWLGRTMVVVDRDEPVDESIESPMKMTAMAMIAPRILKKVFEKLRTASLNNESDIQSP